MLVVRATSYTKKLVKTVKQHIFARITLSGMPSIVIVHHHGITLMLIHHSSSSVRNNRFQTAFALARQVSCYFQRSPGATAAEHVHSQSQISVRGIMSPPLCSPIFRCPLVYRCRRIVLPVRFTRVCHHAMRAIFQHVAHSGNDVFLQKNG